LLYFVGDITIHISSCWKPSRHVSWFERAALRQVLTSAMKKKIDNGFMVCVWFLDVLDIACMLTSEARDLIYGIM